MLVDGTDVFTLGKRELARNIAYVAQNARAADMTVYDSVLLGRRPYIGWDATEHDREVVREVIDLMGIGDYELRSVAELSGGEAQKVMLARALAQEPRLLLLDEHTAALDPVTADKVLALTRSVVSERSISCLMITHNMHQALELGTRTLMMDAGRIVLDVSGPERAGMTVQGLLDAFAAKAGEAFDNDRVLLSTAEDKEN